MSTCFTPSLSFSGCCPVVSIRSTESEFPSPRSKVPEITASVEGVLHLPGNPPVKLDSQDLLQIGDKKFYFLLPVRSTLQPSFDRSRRPSLHLSPPVAPRPGASNSDGLPLVASAEKKGHGRLKLTTSSTPADYEHGQANKRARKGEGREKSLGFASTSGSGGNDSKRKMWFHV